LCGLPVASGVAFDRETPIGQNCPMPDLTPLFFPASVAIVGASSNPQALVNRNYVRTLLDFGYKGRVYPVNPHLSEVMGITAYPSLLDVPEPVDYVVCGLPARLTPGLMEQCVAARARMVSLYSAGFGETAEPERLELERTIADIARRGGVRIVGPNCLGVHNPSAGVSFESDCRRDRGIVSFLSQSGGNARDLIRVGRQRGISYCKGISYGNAADLNEADFLQYFAADKDTGVIGAYIEGIKEPGRFLDALMQGTEAKPVIVLKGGRTPAGARAVNSHTGALAGEREVWDAICRQRKVLQVEDIEEMADIFLAFSYLDPPRGRRVGIIGIGGGSSVQAADDCERIGLTVPPLPSALREELKAFTPLTGVGLSNPIDTAADVYWDAESYARTVRLVAGFDGVDMVFVVIPVIYAVMRGTHVLGEQVEAIVRVAQECGKPLAMVLRTGGMVDAETAAAEMREHCIAARVPVFPGVRHAARAVHHLAWYYEKRSVE